MQYRNSSYASGAFDTFWFEKNLQGDIIAVYDEGGTLLVSYVYDAWGKPATSTPTYYNGGASTAAQHNPFRYRGYYYDTELGFYYLNSRYYDPETGRFINADKFVNANGDIIGFNMFAYCSNNPVMGYDPSGNGWLKDLWEIFVKVVTDTFGFSGNVGVEIVNNDTVENYIVYSYEEGSGYNKSFDNGKPVNLYFSASQWYDLGSYSLGVDVNVDGNGAGFSIGPESSITWHTNNVSGEFGFTDGGNMYFKKAYVDPNTGIYNYTKTTINNRNIAALAAVAVIGGYYLLPMIPGIIHSLGTSGALGATG